MLRKKTPNQTDKGKPATPLMDTRHVAIAMANA
jgi:hypothetical protein